MIPKDAQMDIIAEYYMVRGDYLPNETFSNNYRSFTHIKIRTQPTLIQAYTKLMERSGTAQTA
mgnify:CR=1 FL=1